MNTGKKTDKQRTMMNTENSNTMNKKETRTWATYKRGTLGKQRTIQTKTTMNETYENPTKSNETHKTTNGTGRRNMIKYKKENGR